MPKPTKQQRQRRRYLQLSTKKRVNVTTMTGKLVHAPCVVQVPGSDWIVTGLPLCTRYMTGIVYTDEAVNCKFCLKDLEATVDTTSQND